MQILKQNVAKSKCFHDIAVEKSNCVKSHNSATTQNRTLGYLWLLRSRHGADEALGVYVSVAVQYGCKYHVVLKTRKTPLLGGVC